MIIIKFKADDSQFFKFNPKIRLNGKSSIIVKGASKINDQISMT